jgi:hypothetical protein
MADDAEIITYLRRAEELLRIAEEAKEQRIKEVLIECASEYLRWAQRLQEGLN